MEHLWPRVAVPVGGKLPYCIMSRRLAEVARKVGVSEARPGLFIAALTISSALPIALFLLFQRLFLRGPGLSGAIKG
jgi:multiple sugar transport system permease protein